MIKKIGIAVTGLALIGVVAIGLNSSFTQQANHGDVPAPQRPDFISNYEHVNVSGNYADGNTGAVALDHGRPPAPAAYEYNDTLI